MIDRRALLQSGLAASAAILARARLAAAQAPDHGGHGAHKPAPLGPMKLTKGRAVPGENYTPVVQPNGWTLPFEKKAGAKVFHLIAEPVKHVIAPGLEIEAWGYNGSTPGPLIECVEGDKRPHLRHEQAARGDQRALARRVPAERDGRRRRAERSGRSRRARRSSTSSRCRSRARSCTTRTSTR